METVQKEEVCKPLTEQDIAERFGLKRAGEWLEQAKTKPRPRELLGELWREGELAIMFADTGKGKSILAVQIAEAIARGTGVGPFKTLAKPQNVLYLDCELTEKQFEMRYAREADDGSDQLTGHYPFADNLFRAEIDAADTISENDQNSEEYLLDVVDKLALSAEASAIIIDNISILKRTGGGEAAALRLMRGLRKLKNERGLAILVLAHTPKHSVSKPLTLNDLAGYKTLSNFADSVFAIGQSRMESDTRYIKHLKQRSSEIFCDGSHVPSFRILKQAGNFLAFEFIRYTTEALHLFNYADKLAVARAADVKSMAARGMTQRAIASEIRLSLGAVNKYLNAEPLAPDQVERSPLFALGAQAFYFPGREKIDEKIRKAKSELAKMEPSIIRQNRECDLEDLAIELDAALTSHWVANGKITAEAADKWMALQNSGRQQRANMFVMTPLYGQAGYKRKRLV